MKLLSLRNINEVSPYEVSWTGVEYIFTTSANVRYRVSFTEEPPIGGCDTYQFIFFKIDKRSSSHDPKVKLTLFSILEEFFASHTNVLLYICDTSDTREAGRNRLFLKWFEESNTDLRYTIRTASVMIEGEGFYTAIIADNSNPRLHDIMSDFDDTARELTANKPKV